jgi:hypothetical protein
MQTFEKIIDKVYAFAIATGALGLCVGVGVTLALLLVLGTNVASWLTVNLGPFSQPGTTIKDFELLIIWFGGIIGFGAGCRANDWW